MPGDLSWPILGMVAASALFWMVYIDSKDRFRPEPPFRLVAAFAIGMGSAIVALGVFSALAALELTGTDPFQMTLAEKAILCFGFIGPVEEGAKVLAAWFLVFRWQVFDEPIDGFVYAAAIALGFASLENLVHLPELGRIDQLARTLTLPITHSLFAAVWGFGIAHARLKMDPGWKSWGVQAGSIVAAALLHGLYDFVLFAWNQSLVASGLVLILWVFVIVRAHRLVKAQRQRSTAITGKHSPVRITGLHPPVSG